MYAVCVIHPYQAITSVNTHARVFRLHYPQVMNRLSCVCPQAWSILVDMKGPARRLSARNAVYPLVAISLGTVGLFVFLVGYSLHKTTAASFSQDDVSAVYSSDGDDLARVDGVSFQDTDGDGLYDWEEVLWSSDPLSPDSDGDGVSDGKEVQAGASPSKDSATSSGSRLSTTPAVTATQAVSRQLMAAALARTSGSGAQDVKSEEQVLTTALNEAQAYLVVPPYTASEIKSTESTPDSRTIYVATLLGIFTAMTAASEDETFLLQRIAQGDTSALVPLTSIAETYRGQTEQLRRAPVPSDAAAMHIRLVNALLMYSNALEGIVAFYEDPILAAAALNTFTPRHKELVLAVYDLKLYFDSHNIKSVPDA